MTNTQPQTLDEVLDQAQAHFMLALQLAEKAHQRIDKGLLLLDAAKRLREQNS